MYHSKQKRSLPKCACFMWFLAEFAWNSYGLPLPTHPGIHTNDCSWMIHFHRLDKADTLRLAPSNRPSSYQGPTLSPVGCVSKIILPLWNTTIFHWTTEPWKMGERVTLQNEFMLLKQPTLFFVVLKNARFLLPQHVIVGRQKLPTSKVVEPVSRPWGLSGGWWEGQWVWMEVMQVHLQGAKSYASSLLGFDVGKLVTRGSKLSTRISHVSCSPPFLCFLLAIDITCSENCQGLLYSPPIFGGDQVGRHHTQAACQRVFFVVFPWIHGSIRKDYLHLFLLFHGLHFGTGPQSCHFVGSPKKQLGKSPS